MCVRHGHAISGTSLQCSWLGSGLGTYGSGRATVLFGEVLLGLTNDELI